MFHRLMLIGLLAFCHHLCVVGQESAPNDDVVRKAVVKIYSIRRSHSLSTPWKRLTSSTVTGSGVVLSPTRVLTNHHVIASTTDVSISLDGQSDRLSGRVFASSPGLDLALIELEEPLPEDIVPLKVAEKTPAAGEEIQVFGYPKAATHCRSPKGSSRGWNTFATATTHSDCEPRSMRPSIAAIAADQ